MAEKGIIVNDAASGESVACRDAVELDDDSNARVIQRVDVTKGKVGSLPVTTAAAGLRHGNVKDTNFNLENIITNWTGSFVEIGDNSTLVVFAEFELDQTQEITVMPIILNSDDIVVGLLESKTFGTTSGDARYKGNGPAASGSGSGTGLGSVTPGDNGGWSGYHVTPCQSWDVCGAYKVFLYIEDFTHTTQGYFSVWGYAI